MTVPGWYPDPLGGPGNRYWNGEQWDGLPADRELPHDPQPEKPTRSRFLVPALVGVVGLMSGMLLMLLWPNGKSAKSSDTTPEASPATSATAVPTTTSPGATSELAADMVKRSMQRDLDQDPELGKLDLKVVDVTLVNKSGNEYKGIATVRTPDGVTHDVPVDVTADGSNLLWETPPGAFIFAQKPPPPPKQTPEPPPSAMPPRPPDVEDFTMCPSGFSGVASEDTSCAFADSVRRSWYLNHSGGIVLAYSPVTQQLYTMKCAPATTTVWPEAKRCVGQNASGATLVVYID